MTDLNALLKEYQSLESLADRRALSDDLSDEDKNKFWALVKNSFFIPENKGEERTDISPSGKYTLKITKYATGKGTWGYTEGAVYDSEGEFIESLRRNYSSFPFCWVEGHPNGHDYLIGGESYMGQTIIELDTGVKKSTPQEKHGFCWANIKNTDKPSVILVEGCYWGGGYDVVVVDFSDPLSVDWPEIFRSESPTGGSAQGLDGNVLKLKGDRFLIQKYEDMDWDEGEHEELKKLDHLAGQYVDELRGEDLKLVEDIKYENNLWEDEFCKEISDMEFSVTLEDIPS